MHKLAIFFFVALSALLWACGSNSSSTDKTLSGGSTTPSVLASKVPFVITDSSQVEILEGGVKMYFIEKGSGAVPNRDAHVLIHYHGMLMDGTVFDSSFERGQPADFVLNALIQGWQVALTKAPSGSKVKLIIPPDMGYGAGGSGSIPPNSTLVFDIELISTY